jgi:hypothetical protein
MMKWLGIMMRIIMKTEINLTSDPYIYQTMIHPDQIQIMAQAVGAQAVGAQVVVVQAVVMTPKLTVKTHIRI